MRLAYSANAYTKYSAVEAIRRVAAVGYEGIELMADVPHAWPETVTDEELAAIRKVLDETGLAIANVNAFMMNAVGDPRHPYWHPSWIEKDAGKRSIRVEHTKRSLRMAKRLGARCITTEPGGPMEKSMTHRTAMDRFVEELKGVYAVAETEGVDLLIEPEPQLLIETVDQFLELADRIDSPRFGLNFDIGHFFCVGEDLPTAIGRCKDWTRHYHFEDIAANRVHQHLIPGRGAIDFASVLGAISATGYADWITVELYLNIEDPDGAGREALGHLQAVLAGQ